MSDGGSLINFGDLSKPATVLIEKISEAVGGAFRPSQIRRVARAEADAEKIRAAADIEVTELQRRALNRFINEEAQRQANIESITRLALPDVSPDAKPEGIESDWITKFFEQCRLISDEDMQKLWAKILAGQANRPGSFSKRTVALVAALEKSDVETFEKLSAFAWGPHQTPLVFDVTAEIYKRGGIRFRELCDLDDVGLIRYSGTSPQIANLVCQGNIIQVTFSKSEGNQLTAGHVMLSKLGLQLAPLCRPNPIKGFVEYVVEQLRHQAVKVEIIARDARPATEALPTRTS